MPLGTRGGGPPPRVEEGLSPAVWRGIVWPFMYTGANPGNKFSNCDGNRNAFIILRNRSSVPGVHGSPSAGFAVGVLVAVPLPLFNAPISDGSLRSVPLDPSSGYEGLVLGIEEADVLNLVPYVFP